MIFVLALALPVTVYLLRSFTLFRSRAANVQLSFSPSSLTIPSAQRLAILVNSGASKVAFSRVVVNFDTSKVQLADDVQLPSVGTVPSLSGIVQVTSKQEANSNGRIVLVLVPCKDQNPNCANVDRNAILPSGTFQLASLSFAPVTGQSGQTTVSFNTSDIQIVENTQIAFATSATSATLTLGQAATPTPIGSACGTKAGDTNNDNKVDILDIGNVVRAYGSNPVSNPCADLDQSGAVNILDIGIVVRNYGL